MLQKIRTSEDGFNGIVGIGWAGGCLNWMQSKLAAGRPSLATQHKFGRIASLEI
jgi:hypothetical protein